MDPPVQPQARYTFTVRAEPRLASRVNSPRTGPPAAGSAVVVRVEAGRGVLVVGEFADPFEE